MSTWFAPGSGAVADEAAATRDVFEPGSGIIGYAVAVVQTNGVSSDTTCDEPVISNSAAGHQMFLVF